MKSKTIKHATKNITEAIAISVAILGSVTLVGGIKNGKMFDGIDKDRFLKTAFNVPMYLPVKNNVVKLNILDDFPTEQQQEIVKGIKKLDNYIDGFDYDISFNDKELKKHINIRAFRQNESNLENALAKTEYRFNTFTAQIKYPLTIRFDKGELYSSVDISAVIQHELMHTLGFTDLYDEQYKDSLMYYSYNDNLEPNQEEKQILKKLYGGKDNKSSIQYEVILPTKVKIEQLDEMDEQQLLTF